MAGPGPGAALESPRQLLGRVRFLAEAAKSLRAGRPLPAALAFVPREVLYKLYKDPAGPSRVLLPVWEAEGLGLRVGATGPAETHVYHQSLSFLCILPGCSCIQF